MTKTKYSASFKASIVSKFLSSNGPSVLQLAQEFNLSQSTIYQWITSMNRTQQSQQNTSVNSARLQDITGAVKLKAIIETYSMTAEERNEYCRKNGMFSANIDDWTNSILACFSNEPNKPAKSKEQQQDKLEIKKLNQDLNRKDKALAEVSALLILQKKAKLLWGLTSEGDS